MNQYKIRLYDKDDKEYLYGIKREFADSALERAMEIHRIMYRPEVRCVSVTWEKGDG
jgi:hypothetical protein